MNHDWRYGASLLLLLGQTRANVMLYCMRARWRATVISDAHISPSHCLQLTLAGADWFESQLLDYDVYSNWFVRLGITTEKYSHYCQLIDKLHLPIP